MKRINQKLTMIVGLLMAVQVYGQWVQTAGPQGSPIRALAIDGGMVLAGTDNGVFSSKNNGNDWVETNAGLAKDTVVSLAVNGSKLFAGTLHSGIFASPDNGSSWTAVNQGLTGDPLDMSSYPQINGMAADGNNLYAYAIRSGIFLSQNGGMSWTPINSGLTSTNVFSLAVSGSDLFAGTGDGGGVFISSDNGATWKAVNNGLSYTPGMVYSIYTLAASNGRLFAGTVAGGIYRTGNNGGNWIDASNGLSADIVTSLYADGGNLFAGTGSSGVFLSIDNGASWAAISNGLPANDAVLCLSINDSALFAGLYGGGVWRHPLIPAMQSPGVAAFEKSPAANAFSVSSTSGVLRYLLPVTSLVSIRYYDLKGRLLASLVEQNQAAGTYSLAIPSFPQGFYVRDFRAGTFVQKDRVTILR